jgi:uncharacterized protein
MIGSLVNAAAIVVGSLIGTSFNKHIPERIKKAVMHAIGLCVLVIGMDMALKTQNILFVIICLVLGAIVGELIDVEKRLDRLGEGLKRIVKSKDSGFVEGFVSASLIFCIGAMAIVGAIEDGTNNNPSILYTKSILDGTASIAFSSGMGIGVLFSAIPILIYQGGITLLAQYAKGCLTEAMIREVSAVGGILIIGIGINVLEIRKINLVNMLPAIFLALALGMLLF